MGVGGKGCFYTMGTFHITPGIRSICIIVRLPIVPISILRIVSSPSDKLTALGTYVIILQIILCALKLITLQS